MFFQKFILKTPHAQQAALIGPLNNHKTTLVFIPVSMCNAVTFVFKVNLFFQKTLHTVKYFGTV